MLVIKNIESIKYQKVTVDGKIWNISNVCDYPGRGEYWFFLTDGNISIRVILDRNEMVVFYKGETWSIDNADIKTMWAFVRTLHKVLNDK